MRPPSILALCAALLALAACQSKGSDNWGPNQIVATPNAPAKQMESSPMGSNGQPATPGPGLLLGGWVGNKIGGAMNEADRAKNKQAEKRAYTTPVGQQVTWSNPENNNSGTIIPVYDGYNNNGTYCREFKQTVTIGGQQQQGTVRACQQPDGNWQIAHQISAHTYR